MDATIDGKRIVDPKAMGGCNTKLSPDSDKFIYIDCTVSNSKGIAYKFRMNDITYVERALSQ
jgi:superfamily II helicase